MTSVEEKPLTGDQATNFAKRELQNDLGRKSSEATIAAALAAGKYEGDFARIMTAATPAATPAPTGETPAPAEPAAGEKPAEPGAPAATDTKDAPKNWGKHKPPADPRQLFARQPVDGTAAAKGGISTKLFRSSTARPMIAALRPSGWAFITASAASAPSGATIATSLPSLATLSGSRPRNS